MNDINSKLKKTFESLNKSLYRTTKALELYNPLAEIFTDVSKNFREIELINTKNAHLNKEIELEIKKRELISLYKKMNSIVSNIKSDMDIFYKEMNDGNVFLEKFRTYRRYVFVDTKKSEDFLKKIIDSFNIEEFILKFNVVGTIDINEISSKVKGKKIGTDIVVLAENLNLIYEEILKSKVIKFRLLTDSIIIYFEKDNVLYIEGPSKKIKLCDIDAQNFDAKILDD